MGNTSEYNRSYYQKNKEKVDKQHKRWEQENKEKRRAYQNRYYQKAREKALELLGRKCFFCGWMGKVYFHKKDGRRHGKHAALLVLKNPEQFVILCHHCHEAVHWVMRHLGLTWGEVSAHLDK